jgi:type I restriction enzyme M protein
VARVIAYRRFTLVEQLMPIQKCPPPSECQECGFEPSDALTGKHGQPDHNKAKTGDDLRDFVNGKPFPYLQGFKQMASGPNTIEYKIGEITNKIQSGYNLREIIDHIDELRFRSQKGKHELSQLYEAKIKNMGNGGEYYTPRPLIRAIVQIVQPKIDDQWCKLSHSP